MIGNGGFCHEAGQVSPDGWENGGRPSRPRFARHLRLTIFLNSRQAYVMVRSVPAKPGRVSNHARRRCNAIPAQPTRSTYFDLDPCAARLAMLAVAVRRR